MNDRSINILKRTKNSSVGYIRAIEKQFLKRNTVEEHVEFLKTFKKFHSNDEIIFLKNALKSENSIFNILVQNITNVLIAMATAFVATFGTLLVIIFNFYNVHLGVVMEEISSGSSTTTLTGVYDNFAEIIILSTNLIMPLFGLFFIFVCIVIVILVNGRYRKITKYIGWLETIIKMECDIEEYDKKQ